jgi:hypothetical protein
MLKNNSVCSKPSGNSDMSSICWCEGCWGVVGGGAGGGGWWGGLGGGGGVGGGGGGRLVYYLFIYIYKRGYC